MKKLKNVHPGTILEEEFLKPLNITGYQLSKSTGMPQTRISSIIKGRRSVTADTALRLSQFFGMSPQFWMGLQADYDLEEEQNKLKRDLKRIPNYKEVIPA